MAAPAPAAPQAVRVYPAKSWFLLIISAVLFTVGAFAFGGDALGGIPGSTWLAAGFAAWVLSGAVP